MNSSFEMTPSPSVSVLSPGQARAAPEARSRPAAGIRMCFVLGEKGLLAFLAIYVSLIAWLVNALVAWPESRWGLMASVFAGSAMMGFVVMPVFLFRLERLVMRLIRQLEVL
jgi:hypothetical protein